MASHKPNSSKELTPDNYQTYNSALPEFVYRLLFTVHRLPFSATRMSPKLHLTLAVECNNIKSNYTKEFQ